MITYGEWEEQQASVTVSNFTHSALAEETAEGARLDVWIQEHEDSCLSIYLSSKQCRVLGNALIRYSNE